MSNNQDANASDSMADEAVLVATEALFKRLRTSSLLHLSASDVISATGIPREEIAVFVTSSGVFEVAEFTTPTRTARLLRARCEPGNILRLLPMDLNRLRNAYGDSPDKLTTCIDELQSAGSAVVKGTNLEPRSPAEPAVPALEADLRVLNLLEDLEQDRINYGLYETFVTEQEILERSRAVDGDGRLGEMQVQDGLARLEAQAFVVRLNGKFRSRISEIARLLKNVKQRFRSTQVADAPFLVDSLQVRFRNREQLVRRRVWEPALDRVKYDNLELHDSHLIEAIDAIKHGFSRAIGRQPADTELTGVQRRSLERLAGNYLKRSGGGFVITGNTGSGKTEAALLPLLLGAVQERLSGVRGCKILLVYPRQALAKNQLSRLARYVSEINYESRSSSDTALSIGIAFGETPIDQREIQAGRFYNKSLMRGKWENHDRGFVLPYFRDEDEPVYCRHLGGTNWALQPHSRSWELANFRATRRAIQQDPPDILVITTEMLHRWLLDPAFGAFFGLAAVGGVDFCPPRTVVLDEIHLYDTIHGAQIGMLLRRLRHRIETAMAKRPKEGWTKPILVGMSATIGDPVGFWRDLSGVHPSDISVEPGDVEETTARDYFLFIRPETYSRGKHVGDASTAIQTIMALAHNMRRRPASNGESAKFRTLVFQDSIGKVKKLALEFNDAETNKRLSMLRLDLPPGITDERREALFNEGEYWYFDDRDENQFSALRLPGQPPTPLTATESPIYSGTGKFSLDLLQRDVIFATTSLEVGYDDPSIQLVFQHRAPRNAASFIQKKGRGGRALRDRPITAVTLSSRSYRDAFFYQNPELLYDPIGYAPPLNVDNHFIQRFHAVALIFDVLALTSDRIGSTFPTLEAHLAAIDGTLSNPIVADRLQKAFMSVLSRTFQGAVRDWQSVWTGFKNDLREAEGEYRSLKVRTHELLQLCPDMPRTLFGTINMPTVQMMSPRAGTDSDFRIDEEDISLVFAEVAPGHVTRRYSRASGTVQGLHWRPPYARVNGHRIDDAVAIERYKPQRKDANGKSKPGPFNPRLLKRVDAPDMWGVDWRHFLPNKAVELFGDQLPDRFYRARYVELWDFGEIPVRDPQQPDVKWEGELHDDGRVQVFSTHYGNRTRNSNRRALDPNSNAYPLSFSVVRPLEGAGAGRTTNISMPPLFDGLLERFEFCFGGPSGQGTMLKAWEVHYGTEAFMRLRPRGRSDKHAGMGYNPIRYVSEHDGKPTFFGYDLETEGFRVPYSGDRLRKLAHEILATLQAQPALSRALQDQYLRFFLKSTPWPVQGLQNPINHFDQAIVADVIATARAESWATNEDPSVFLSGLVGRDGVARLMDVALKYGYDGRTFTEDFIERLGTTLASLRVQEFLAKRAFTIVRNRSSVARFIEDTLVHSLKHACRNLFLLEGSAREEEVGSHAVLGLMYGRDPVESAFYVYERNRGGNGSARAAYNRLNSGRGEYLVKRWWDSTMSCPVGDEETFIKSAIRKAAVKLATLQDAFFSRPPSERENIGPALRALLQDEFGASAFFSDHQPMLGRLAGLLTSEVGFGGRSIRRFGIQRELVHLEDALAHRFGRAPFGPELSGFALQQVEASPTVYPNLSALAGIYRDHTAALSQGWDPTGEEQPGDWRERLATQIEHLSLASCEDGCPACLAASCDLGRIETTRHTLSRRVLKEAHRILAADITVDAATASASALRGIASQHDGYVILKATGEVDPEQLRSFKDAGFSTASMVFDYETFETRTVMVVAPG